jgi:hypothetical protein
MPIYCSCIICKSQLATSQISKHYNSKLCLSGGKYTPLKECPHCSLSKEKIISNFANHVKLCDLNLDKVTYKNTKGSHYADGRNAWNKGKTKNTDSRIAQGVATFKRNSTPLHGKYKDPEKETARRIKLSIAAKKNSFGGYRENAGRSKKFRVVDSFGKETVLQSSYELECFNILTELNIKWVRPKALKYNNRNYFADFYLTDHKIYLDPKNDYKAKQDKEKIEAVMNENDVKVFVLLKEQITKEYITRII